jgi:hypothetical protein
VADGGESAGVRFWCELADCLESSGLLGGRVREILTEFGLDVERFVRCVRERCRQFTPPDEAVPCRWSDARLAEPGSIMARG